MKAPEKIYGWVNGQLSIARYYGGCRFNGQSYFVDDSDPQFPLVRSDVLVREKKAKRQHLRDIRRAQAMHALKAQGDLQFTCNSAQQEAAHG